VVLIWMLSHSVTRTWEASQIFLFTAYYWGNQSEVDKLDWTRNTHGRDNECLQSLVNRRTYEEMARMKLWVVIWTCY